MMTLRFKYDMFKIHFLVGTLLLFTLFILSDSNASEIEGRNIQFKQLQSESFVESMQHPENLQVLLKSAPGDNEFTQKNQVSHANLPRQLVSEPVQGDQITVISQELRNASDNISVVHVGDNPVAKAAVERNIVLFTERIKDRFSLWLSRSGKYLDLIKDILKSKDLPEDIAFLPLIESGFNPTAYSIAKAVGPWQFIASTAKRYGLKIDWWRDERRDPVKSTLAAADYLKDLYSMFGSWNLAMAAYNAGEGKILKALNRTKKDDFWDLTSTKYIKKETKEYVPRFVAARMIATNPAEYGFNEINYHEPFDYDEVVIDHPLDLEVAARCANTTVEVIRELNPELRRWSTPPGESSYALRIPVGKKEEFLRNLSEIPKEKWFSIEKYRVKKGDTIKKIAQKTGIPVNVILELNNGLKTLKAGEIVLLPPKDKYRPDRDDIKKASIKKRTHKGTEMKKTSLRSKKSKTVDKTGKTKQVVVASLKTDQLSD